MDPSAREHARALSFREVSTLGRDSVTPAMFDCVVGFASLTSNVNGGLLSSGDQKLCDNSPEEPNSAAAP